MIYFIATAIKNDMESYDGDTVLRVPGDRRMMRRDDEDTKQIQERDGERWVNVKSFAAKSYDIKYITDKQAEFYMCISEWPQCIEVDRDKAFSDMLNTMLSGLGNWADSAPDLLQKEMDAFIDLDTTALMSDFDALTRDIKDLK